MAKEVFISAIRGIGSYNLHRYMGILLHNGGACWSPRKWVMNWQYLGDEKAPIDDEAVEVAR